MEKEYAESPELKELADKLVKRYSYYIGHVELDSILFSEIEGEKPKKSKIGSLAGVTSSWVKQLLAANNEKLYCLSVYASEWESLLPQHREWLMFDLLMSVDPAGSGKLRKPDVCEWGIIVEYLGPYWRTKEDLPSLLMGADPLPLPVPPLVQDEGATTDL